MTKKLLAVLLAGALILVGFAACGKKQKGNSDNSNYIEDDNMVVDNVLVESRDAAGNFQKDASGKQIYDRFSFENLDDETVEITAYLPQIIGNKHVVNAKTVISYIRCYTPHTVVIPETLAGKRVVSIGESVFAGKTDLNSIVIPSSVTSIGAYAFAVCSELAAVSVPSSVTSIGECAFYGCTKLATVTFAATSELTTIPASAFMNCTALTAVNIPAYIQTVEDNAFLGCSAMTTLTVAEGVATIGAQAFGGLTALTTVTLPASVTTMGKLNFHGCEALTGAGVTAPAGSVAKQYMDRVVAGDVPTEPVTTAP